MELINNSRFIHVFFVVFVTLILLFVDMECSSLGKEAPFDQNYQLLFGDNHITRFDRGQRVQLMIDPSSGAGFRSKLDYLSGFFEIRIKLPPKSDGIITTFYLITGLKGSKHNELDFEFLGDDTLQTNIYVNDVGGREQRIRFWFDPTADFHTYKILWNPSSIMFFVDDIPIRVFKNRKQEGIPFPDQFPMHIEATLWAAAWAGGPVNWKNGPFKAQYEGFAIHGCPSSSGFKGCGSPNLPWNKVHGLSPKQMEAYNGIKKNFIVYDYCSDPKRQPVNPKECQDL